MMLTKVISFAVVCIDFAFGANIRTPSLSDSCSSNIAGAPGAPHWECTASSEWLGDGFNKEHCLAAIQRLYNVEVTKHGSTEFEFLLPGAVPYTSNPVMQTPRRYTYGQSCLIAKTCA